MCGSCGVWMVCCVWVLWCVDGVLCVGLVVCGWCVVCGSCGGGCHSLCSVVLHCECDLRIIAIYMCSNNEELVRGLMLMANL